ncbi:hypothetical protein [Sinomonas flava]|uniref:Uncharacterized protein n=1 Tax=Sinomonas flava TaxID=496857 RepID=A0ABN3C301_9MICC
MADFTDLRRQVRSLDGFTKAAYVEEVQVLRMEAERARRWRRVADPRESWVYISGGDATWAVDRASRVGHHDPVAAVTFPPLHSQLVGWWLFHAWRSIDLVSAGLSAHEHGTTSIAAITSRALIEELGCLVTEVRQIKAAWEVVKRADLNPVRRGELAKNQLGSVLARFLFATRMSSKPANAPDATNVLTYIKKLDKLSKSSKFSEWYDWLSDASHPAYGARLVYVTNPMRHATGAVMLRFHSRSPLHLEKSSGERVDFTYDIEEKAETALESCGTLLIKYLKTALSLVDDFGLTTSAATLTSRTYWRNLLPAASGDECACGCGPWAQSIHVWEGGVQDLPPLNG